MTKQVQDWLLRIKKQIGKQKKVLEVGSMDCNGGDTPRTIFKDSKEYIALDMRPGKNVDVVLNAHELKLNYEQNHFDTVLCLETLEHDDQFWITVENMKWVLKPKGYLIITVPGGSCPQHNHPDDYWRFMEGGIRLWYQGFKNVEIKEWRTERNEGSNPDGWLSWGQKP